MRARPLERASFLALLAIVSIGFGWIVYPLFGAIMWAVAFAVIFRPANRAVCRRLHGRETLAAMTTTALVLLLVLLPAILLAGFIVQEASDVTRRLRAGEFDVAGLYQRGIAVLPGWLVEVLNAAGLSNLGALIDRLKTTAAEGTQPIASQVWHVGQGTLDFSVSFLVMLYLLFFLLRDGDAVMAAVKRSVPLDADVQQRLFDRFRSVIRSTVKGNVVVALLQGALGGIALMLLGIPAALLWAAVMAFLSLLPAIGAALVWGPIAAWLLIDGRVWQGLALIAFGALVIGLVDNLLRPILVGKESRIPDYVVLVTTIGGMTLFGINGFVIGPLVAALFISAWEIFAASDERADITTDR
jgi:predicted PurR-regulated permease PerM